MREIIKYSAVLLLVLAVSEATGRTAYAETAGALPDTEISESELAALEQELSVQEAAGDKETGTADSTENYDSYAFPDEQNAFSVNENPEREISFDSAAGLYTYRLPDKSSWSMSVPDGACTAGTVRLSLDSSGVLLSVRKNEEMYSAPDTLAFEEPGRYQAEFFIGGAAPQDEDDIAAYTTDSKTEIYHITVSFTIFTSPTNAFREMQAPAGFRLRQVSLNQKQIPAAGDTAEFTEDGDYGLVFCGIRDSSVSYELHFTSDRTAPTISFSPDIKGKTIRAPVRLTPSETDCSIEILRKGIRTADVDHTIRNGGFYSVIITDPAGNETDYQFNVSYPIRSLTDTFYILGGGLLLLFLYAGIRRLQHPGVR